jgi:tetratricopeptide (TPR) repeat protein
MGQHDAGACRLALEQLDKELQTGAGSTTMLNNHAGVLYELGDLREAAAALRRALDVDPMSANGPMERAP